MGKNDIIREISNLMASSLAHKIGSIVNEKEIYADKYRKEASTLLSEARKKSKKIHWNSHDKVEIKKTLKDKLIKELERRDFLNDKKFDLVDEEVERVLKELELL